MPRLAEEVRVVLDCYSVCTETVMHCLERGGQHSTAPHIRLLLDCIEICRASADFMLRDSEFHQQTCAVCADICERCADECGQFAGDDMMERCADICRRCAETCRRMAGSSTQTASM